MLSWERLAVATLLLVSSCKSFTPHRSLRRIQSVCSAFYPRGGSQSFLDEESPLNGAVQKDLPRPVILPANDGPPCVIKILGVGGGGGNAVNRMIQSKISGVEFWAINTDAQALAKSHAPNILNIGRTLTRGLGAGGEPAQGERAAKENKEELVRICEGADMVFITAGMGGGTGSGAAPILAEIAKSDCKCLTVGVVTKPFSFEGRRRMAQADKAIEALRAQVDTLIVVSNDKLLQIVPEGTPVTEAFLLADDILRQGVVGISEIILKTGLVNVDFADVRAVMKDAGTALMGVGKGQGKQRASDAAIAAISSPLLDFPIQKAKRIVFNIVGGEDMGLQEINEASEVIYRNADENANIIFGALVDPAMGKEISITVLACDFDLQTTNQIIRSTSSYSVDDEELDSQSGDPDGKRMNGFSSPSASIADDRVNSEFSTEPVFSKGSNRQRIKKFFGRLIGRGGA